MAPESNQTSVGHEIDSKNIWFVARPTLSLYSRTPAKAASGVLLGLI
jgi:hypothetical protein